MKTRLLILAGATVVLGSLLLLPSRAVPSKTAPEIARILTTTDLSAQTALYRALIARVGLSEAQDDLYHSGLPFDGQSHLLNHESGEFAYKKYGSAGIAYCKDYFLGSCYHGVVLETIAHDGTAGLAHISACWKANETVRIQCAHGIGHGLLAWVGYKHLPQALALCDQLAQDVEGFPTFNCYDGVFMENIWAIHSGTTSPDQWARKEDPYYPCDDPRIEDAWEAGCWAEQPSLVYQATNGDIETVSNLCDSLGESALKTQCFEGLARQIHPAAQGSAEKVAELCGRVAGDWRNFCKTTVAYTEYAVGGRMLPFAICASMGANATSCYAALAEAVRTYSAPTERKSMCGKLPDASARESCLRSE